MVRIAPVFFVLLSLISTPAFAKSIVRVTLATPYAIAFPDQSGATPKVPSMAFGMNLTFPIGSGVTWQIEPAAVVPNVLFQPAARLSTAISIKLSENTALGLGGFYQLNPGYTGKSLSHLGVVSVAPSVAVTREVSLSLAVGGGLTSEGVPLLVFGPKIAFLLP